MPKTNGDQEKTSSQNQLAHASSPYLLQHANNPVDWWEWGDAALTKAQAENKPILLSIGYAACHWCHVMAHESFEDEEVAELMNRYYINIKVDREERPDIDQIYMSALHSMGEQGGWPLTMFLTPMGEPFWGGTYFPKHRSYGRPGFMEVLHSIQKTFYETPENVTHNVFHVKQFLTRDGDSKGDGAIAQFSEGFVKEFSENILGLVDWQNGGIRGAPKFPNAPMNEALFRGFKTYGNQTCKKAFLQCVQALAQGGIYDHLRGGLARYATDEQWLIPHFEKMLYDNGHFLRQLAWSFGETKHALFAQRIHETIDWLKEEMLLQEGAFASSLDADSEGEEGKFYVWQWDELAEILGEDLEFFAQHYNLYQGGNWEGKNILNRELKSDLLSEAEEARLWDCRIKLLHRRKDRVRPNLDDKILLDWNAYIIRGLVEAGLVLNHEPYLAFASSTYQALMALRDGEALPHSYRSGNAVFPCFATDYAAMMNAALSLYEALGESSYLEDAKKFFKILQTDFSDRDGGFFLTSIKSKGLIMRPRGDRDEANPSANSQILEALCRLNAFSLGQSYQEAIEALVNNLYVRLNKQGFGNACFMNALNEFFSLKEVLIVAKDKKSAEPFLQYFWQNFEPNRVVKLVLNTENLVEYQRVALDSYENSPAIVLICQNNSCQMPITDIETLIA